jgi:methylglutaconyl-CoA hydratase
MEGKVDYVLEQGIGRITFEHPAHNSLPGYLLAALTGTIEKAGKDNRCRLLVLTSGGNRTFCAGASFDELLAIDNPVSGKEFFMGFARVINAMRKCPKFIVGRVQGKAVGGGVGLAAAVDYCFATTFASIKLSELALGIGPFVVGPAVERKIGTSAFSQLAIGATGWKSAEWAADKGLFADVLSGQSELDKEIDKLCTTLAGFSPKAMSNMKKILWKGTEDWDQLLEERAAISGQLILSDQAKEAIAKIKQK